MYMAPLSDGWTHPYQFTGGHRIVRAPLGTLTLHSPASSPMHDRWSMILPSREIGDIHRETEDWHLRSGVSQRTSPTYHIALNSTTCRGQRLSDVKVKRRPIYEMLRRCVFSHITEEGILFGKVGALLSLHCNCVEWEGSQERNVTSPPDTLRTRLVTVSSQDLPSLRALGFSITIFSIGGNFHVL